MMLESASPPGRHHLRMTCEELRASVQDWIGTEFEYRPSLNDCLIATLPLPKPNGGAIETGLEPLEGDRWRASDLGETYDTLYLAGVEMADEHVPQESLGSSSETMRS